MSSAHTEKEISLLEILKTSPSAGQRDMAEAIGLSLGMTNLLLKELSAKGWMLMRRLSTRKVQYVLTPEGLNELSKRSYRFLKKSIRHVADCRVQLEALVHNIKLAGHPGCALVGRSEVDFVLEYLCRQNQIEFGSFETKADESSWFTVYGENEPTQRPNLLEYLSSVVRMEDTL